MQHFALRIAVAFLTFIIGTAVSAVWGLFKSEPAAATEGVLIYAGTKSCPSARPAVEAPRPPLPVIRHMSQTVRGGVLNGKAISKPAPEYPALARAARASGTVTVEIVVDESGRVTEAVAVSGHPLLYESAVSAVRQWRFTPTLLSGQPVKVSGVAHVNYDLR